MPSEPAERLGASWRERLSRASKTKEKFNTAAGVAMDLTFGTSDMTAIAQMLATAGDLAPPQWKHRTNKGYELVRIMGPALVHKNPTRMVTARIMDPQTQWLAELMEAYLNYTALELNLKGESRKATDEAIIKGAGMLVTGFDEKKGLIGSKWENIGHLLLDPDALDMDDIAWGAILRREPIDDLRARYGPEALKDVAPNASQVSDDGVQREKKEEHGERDIVAYWEVFSTCGFGDETQLSPEREEPHRVPQVVHLCIPALSNKILFAEGGWPIPFYADGIWPWSVIALNPVPGQLWPDPMLKPGISEALFQNWAMGRLMGKINSTCRDFIAVHQGVEEGIQSAVEQGKDLTVLSIKGHEGSVSDMVQFLQHPPMNPDMMKILEKVEEHLDKRLGLQELLYGFSENQYRSAEEASVKDRNTRLRIDDAADKVEDWQSQIARKEALAARWMVEPEQIDALPFLAGGLKNVPPGVTPGMIWGYYRQGGLEHIAREFEYRIESGSMRKPNRERLIDQANQMFRDLGPVLQVFAQTGQVGPLNELIAFVLKANDVSNPERFLLAPPAPQVTEEGPVPPPSGPFAPEVQ